MNSVDCRVANFGNNFLGNEILRDFREWKLKNTIEKTTIFLKGKETKSEIWIYFCCTRSMKSGISYIRTYTHKRAWSIFFVKWITDYVDCLHPTKMSIEMMLIINCFKINYSFFFRLLTDWLVQQLTDSICLWRRSPKRSKRQANHNLNRLILTND